MNKNTLLAFVLILGSVTFFSSPVYQKFWIEKVQGKKYEPVYTKTIETTKEEIKKEKETASENKKEIAKEEKNENIYAEINSIDSIKLEQKTDTVWVENEKMIVGISEKGANIVSIKMKDYKYNESDNIRKKNELIDLIPKNDKNAAQLSISGESYDNKLFKNTSELKKINIKEKDKTLEFQYDDNGKKVIKEYSFDQNSYKIGLKIRSANLSGKRVQVSWKSGIEESEMNNQNSAEKRNVHYFTGENLNHINMKKEGRESTTGQCKWVGITSKYFFVGIVADTISDADISYNGFEDSNNNSKEKNINYEISYEKTAESNEVGFWFYTGPSKYENLKNEGVKFEKVLFPVIGWTKNILFADSWFPPIAEFVLWILLGLTRIVKDYGIAILLLTLISKIVTFPMMHSSTKQMNKMRDLQPKMNLIREKFKNNPKKMNEELMELYKKEGVNPLNFGCLPMFLQMPIFIALFVVLKKAIELRGAGTFILPWVSDLSKPESLFSLKGIFENGLPMYGSSIALMPILMAVIQYYQNKMTIKDPNQKAMIYFMPIFMLVLFNNFPAGVVLYWTFQSGLGLVQQIITDMKKKNNPITANKK